MLLKILDVHGVEAEVDPGNAATENTGPEGRDLDQGHQFRK